MPFGCNQLFSGEVMDSRYRLLISLHVLVLSTPVFYYGWHAGPVIMEKLTKTGLDGDTDCSTEWPGSCKPASTRSAHSINNQTHQDEQPPKIILYWTTIGGSTLADIGPDQFQRSGCEYYNCRTTHNKSLSIDADALLFHMRDKLVPLPETRLAHQRYVFFNREASLLGKNLTGLTHFFNWTMTYRRESDVFLSYGEIKRRRSSRPYLNSSTLLEKVSGKTKMAAWFVSHCETRSKREQYVEELRKHINVDVYGKCGSLKCGKEKKAAECYHMLDRDYMFYLSFENSLCEDYVTEKLFNVLQWDVIPVVYGAANYSKYAPPHAVIHVDDFRHPKDLAAYLKALAQNATAYVEYFRWKVDFEFSRTDAPTWYSSCEICKKLHTDHGKSVYEDIERWWGEGRCRMPNVTF